MIGLLGGGLALEFCDDALKLKCYAGVFALALIARLASVYHISFQSRDRIELSPAERVRVRDMFKSLFSERTYRSMFLFLFVFNSVVFLSAPFVTPYLLKARSLNYFDFTMTLAALFVGKVLFLSVARRAIEKIGLRWVFIIGTIGVSPLPGLWPYLDSLAEFCALQFFSGGMWAFFEVALTLIFFDRVKEEHKIAVLSLYNLVNTLALVLGAAIGAQYLRVFADSPPHFDYLFVCGSVLRTVVALLLVPWIEVIPSKVPILFKIAHLSEGITASFRQFLVERR